MVPYSITVVAHERTASIGMRPFSGICANKVFTMVRRIEAERPLCYTVKRSILQVLYSFAGAASNQTTNQIIANSALERIRVG